MEEPKSRRLSVYRSSSSSTRANVEELARLRPAHLYLLLHMVKDVDVFSPLFDSYYIVVIIYFSP